MEEFYINNSLTDKVIVLDLDETLIHTEESMKFLTKLNIVKDPKMYSIRERVFIIDINDENDSYKLWGTKRPHLDDFLNFCFDYFELVIVWSAGKSKYVKSIVSELFIDLPQPNLVYTYDNIFKKSGKSLQQMIDDIPYLKENKKIKDIFIVDDKEYNFIKNKDNGILIPEYNPKLTYEQLSKEDDNLLKLKNWFKKEEVVKSSDIRNLDKTKIFL